MSTIASQITIHTIVCSMRGIHRWLVNSPHKGPVTRKMFPFDDVIMRTTAARTNFMTLRHARQNKSCGKTIVQLGKCISDVFLSGAHKPIYFSCYQAALWMVQSVCLSVRPSVCPSVCHTFLTMFPSAYHHECVRSYYQWQKWRPCKRSRSEVKGQGHRGQH